MAKRSPPSNSNSPDRRSITFEQAEGFEPLPTQLRTKEITSQIRAMLWAVLYESFKENIYGGYVHDNWYDIAKDKFVFRDHRPLDDFQNYSEIAKDDLKRTIFGGEWWQVFGFVEWVLRHPSCPEGLAAQINDALKYCRSAYLVFGGDVIGPMASEEEANALETALSATATKPFQGARAHLKAAISALNDGNAAGSIRESISAVESAASVIAPGTKNLAPALTAIEKSHKIHPALSEGFKKLYGFTSDEKGIRHALLDMPEAKVDDTDALYMLGACAAFVTYLVGRTA